MSGEEQTPEGHKLTQHVSATERGIALALAVAVLITFIVLVLNPRAMDGGTLAIVRFLAATFAGIAGYLFTGSIGLEAKIPWNKTQIRATGAFAAFVLVLFLFFTGVPGLESKDERNQSESNLNSEIIDSVNAQDLALLELYWHPQREDYYVTTNPQAKDDAIKLGYQHRWAEACILSTERQGTVPLNLYWSDPGKDNFTTATRQGIDTAKTGEYWNVRTDGYVYPKQHSEMIPLDLYHRLSRGDNFTTATQQGAKAAKAEGYEFIRTEGYVYPASRCQ
jgi:hypothetical protein